MVLPKDPEKHQEYRNKLSQIVKARCTPQYREKLSKIAKANGTGLWQKGKHHSKETKLKMSQTQKGICNTPEWCSRMSKRTKSQWTSEHRVKISKMHKANGVGKWWKGKQHSEETRLKMSQSQKAKWKGVDTQRSLDPDHHRECWENTEWRKGVFERDEYTCKNCLERGGELNAHHIFWWSEYPIFRYEVWNGITLCVECHRRVHRRETNNE